MKSSRSIFRAGFTLVEILVGIAVVAALSSAGYVSVVNIRESAAENKLVADQDSLNKATAAYLASGGVIPDDATPAEVIAKLKTRATSAVAAQTVGMTGSFIDPRIKPVQVAEGETGSRLAWSSAMQRFVLTKEGDGIRRFELDEALAAQASVTEERTVKLAASDLTSGQPVWIWDHAPNVPTTSSSAHPPGAGTPVATPSTVGTLDPPTFDVSGGAFSLEGLAALAGAKADGSFLLTITNPNRSDISSYLSSGPSATISPGASGVTFSSLVISNDAAWANSSPTIQTYTITPFDPVVTISDPGVLTPFQLGVPRASGSSSSAAVTATILNWDAIPALFRTNENLELVIAVGSTDPSGISGSAQKSVTSTLTTNSFPNGALSLVVSAMAKSKNAALFKASSVSTQTVSATKGTMTVTSTPPGGTILNASETIVLAPADPGAFPSDYSIKYTTDSTDPTANSPTYSAPIIPPASGAVDLRAIAVSASYSDWFDSPIFRTSYTVNAQHDVRASGALVGSATLNSTFVGDLYLAVPANGVINNIAYNKGAWINGNLFVPGTPVVRRSNGTVWTEATNGSFASQILNYETFPTDGSTGTPSSNPLRVIDMGGDSEPSNYSITFNNNSKIQGKIYRQIEHFSLVPYDVSKFAKKNNNGNTSLDNPPSGPLSVTPSASITLNSTPVGQVVLNPSGADTSYGTLTANNDTAFVLNGSNDATNPTIYNIENLNLNSGADIVINGYVVLNIKGNVNLNSGSVIGNAAHPEYLQLNMWGGDVQLNSGSSLYGRIDAPDNQVSFNAGSVMEGSVSAETLTLNSTSIVFSLSPTVHDG